VTQARLSRIARDFRNMVDEVHEGPIAVIPPYFAITDAVHDIDILVVVPRVRRISEDWEKPVNEAEMLDGAK
jgi:hypothetical protein